MKHEHMTQEQRDAVNDLGLQLSDCLGKLNVVLKTGGIVRSEWAQFLDTFGTSWNKYKDTFGISIDEGTRQHVAKALAS